MVSPNVFRYARLRGIRVLVVASDAEIRRLITFMMRMSGAYPLASASATGAKAMLASFRPDVLFVALPLFDADHLLLGEAGRSRIPVVVFDGDRAQIESTQLIMDGFNPMVVKELGVEDVQGAILNAMSGRSAA